MWDAQAGALSDAFRVLRYDRRGHGASTAPPAPYAMADLGGDVLALLDALDIERTHFCGLSIGGLVGQWLGVPADLQAIADGVADGRHLSLPGRHIVNIESADAFSAAVAAFLG